ncbi:MAG: nitronate monooxygenase [Rubrivivax sp.]
MGHTRHMNDAARRLTQLLGTQWPLIQAPMAGSQGSALAVAVSNAGGLGSQPAAMLGAEALAAELQKIRAATSGPFNVNFFCHTPPEPDAAAEARWRAALAPYYAEFGVDPAGIAAGPGRKPFNAEAADVLEGFAPRVVSFHFGLPEPALLARVKRSGAVVLSSATTVEEGLWLQAHGTDAVIAQGLEAGGHRGHFLSPDLTRQMGTFALVPQLVRALSVPVIAAGGIAGPEGVRAALALGAAGVQVGTAYLSCPEATTSALHRAALASAEALATALTNLFTGRPARGIVNRLLRERGPMSSEAPAFPLATAANAPLRAAAEARGSSDFSPLWAGQNAAGCRAMPAAELTRELSGGFAGA